MAHSEIPSTQWRENIAPGEEQKYAEQARRFVEMQKRKSQRFGAGRALHRKQLATARGTLEVLDGLPGFARHGLFAHPGDHEVWMRLSNGGMDRAGDSKPDIRGMALRVFGVHGASALGNGPAKSQDFTLINQEAFAFSGSDEFVGFVMAASHGNGSLLKYLFSRYGLFGAPKRLAGMLKSVGRPFGSFATEPVFSALPMACGPYAARVRLQPAPSNGQGSPEARNDWGADFSARLEKGALHWDMQLQFFVNEQVTPIEDAAVVWPTRYITVARLMLPQQDTHSGEGDAFSLKAEASVFDPWQALAEHRPLGDVQRARKVVYFESQKNRGAA